MNVDDIAAWNRLNYLANTKYSGDIYRARDAATRTGMNMYQPMAERDSFGLEGIYDPRSNQVINNGWDTFTGNFIPVGIAPEPEPAPAPLSFIDFLRAVFGW